MKEKELIPEYKIDALGYYTDLPEGKFRPIDIEDDHIIILKPEQKEVIDNGRRQDEGGGNLRKNFWGRYIGRSNYGGRIRRKL